MEIKKNTILVGHKAITALTFIPITRTPIINANAIAKIPVLKLYFQPSAIAITIAISDKARAIF